MSDAVVHLKGDREDVKPLRPGAGKDVSVDAQPPIYQDTTEDGYDPVFMKRVQTSKVSNPPYFLDYPGV